MTGRDRLGPDLHERMLRHQAERIAAGLEPRPMTPESFRRMEQDAERPKPQRAPREQAARETPARRRWSRRRSR